MVRTGDISDRVGPAPSGTNIVFNAKASGFLAAISSREWRVYSGPYPLDDETDRGRAARRPRAAAFGFDLELELVSATTFYAATRIAETFRRGRVLLAGDAAHVRTPGRQPRRGLRRRRQPRLEAGRGAARSRAATRCSTRTTRNAGRTTGGSPTTPWTSWRSRQATLAEIRRGGVPDDADLSPAAAARRAEIAALIARGGGHRGGVTFDERYDASPVIWYEPGQLADETPWSAGRYEDDPRPGHRAPDGVVDPWGYTLYDRIGNDFALLVLADATGSRRARVRRRGGQPRAAVHRRPPDRSGAARDLRPDNVLVRPDQHVAWRGDAPARRGRRRRTRSRARHPQAADEVPEAGPESSPPRSRRRWGGKPLGRPNPH